MFLIRNNKAHKWERLVNYLKSSTFQRLFTGTITLIIAFFIVVNGAIPKKYSLTLGARSVYDITATRDIENSMRTEQNAKAAAEAVTPVMIRMDDVPFDILNITDDFVASVEETRDSIDKSLREQGITSRDKSYKQKLEYEQTVAAKMLGTKVKQLNVPLSDEQILYLIAKTSDDELFAFRKIIRDLISDTMKDEVTKENLAVKIDQMQNTLQGKDIKQELKIIGGLLVKAVIRPNSTVDEELTRSKRQEAYDNARENKVIIKKDVRILSVGDIVTSDKLEVLKELNLLETGRIDYAFALGILAMLLMLAALLVLYMNHFCKKVLYSRNDLIVLSIIIILTLLAALGGEYLYPTLLAPVFIAPLMISILLDLKLAVFANFILSVIITFITKGNMTFFYMSVISGTFSSFIIFRANQRSKLSVTGLVIAGFNILIAICMGIINKSTLKTISAESLQAFINGIISIIFTIGLLPFWETVFNMLTPLKLLELANPNQPLIKRLLIEAPGTYHHSLMVGNLAEMATETIGGNALLARVGAYFHDIGKLRRPNLFKENQFSDNPHDHMTANLSTLVITSHTHDGVEIAEKYKLPIVIRDIISQHHGTTLVAYFYHKARKDDRSDSVKQEDYRYHGPKPSTKEAAVVMLADSVEAAVRSMPDKTEGKIEGFVRKIIKDKLDDGQLDLCNLTLKDLDDIAKSFMKVFSGFFHEREEYPEISVKSLLEENASLENGIEDTLTDKKSEKKERIMNESVD
jgi:putative nucleotidyltransferase with HDIG domain